MSGVRACAPTLIHFLNMSANPSALRIRSAVVRKGLTRAAFFLAVIYVLLGYRSDDWGLHTLLWPAVAALCIGLYTSVKLIAKIRGNILNGLPLDSALRKISRDEIPRIDWKTIDDYGAQLQSRGFVFQGEFVMHPAKGALQGVASTYIHQSGITLVEIQQFVSKDETADLDDAMAKVQFHVTSLLAGAASASVTSRTLMSITSLFHTGSLNIMVSMPNANLMDLLNAHTKMLAKLKVRSGLLPQSDLTMERFALGQRKHFRQAHQRLSKMSGWKMAQIIDAHDENPVDFWAPDMNTLRALNPQPLATLEFDTSLTNTPAIVNTSASAAMANPL